MIRNNSPYYSAYYFTSSNQIIGQMLEKKSNVVDYFNLVEENKQLRETNAKLKASKYNAYSSYKYQKRSFKNNYTVRESKIINNSINFSQNYLTLDVGLKDGVKVGQGVIGDKGIIGVVKSTSNNFATVTSILHDKMMVSVKVGKERSLATLVWNGDNYKFGNIVHLPRYMKINKGDTVLTSGFGGVFPEEIAVGIISEVVSKKDKSFHSIKLQMINDFSKLNSAYVVIDKNLEEKESLTTEKKDEQ